MMKFRITEVFNAALLFVNFIKTQSSIMDIFVCLISKINSLKLQLKINSLKAQLKINSLKPQLNINSLKPQLKINSQKPQLKKSLT